MVIKQKVTIFPLSPAGDLRDALVNVTRVGTLPLVDVTLSSPHVTSS